jgi:hypothetical protein
MSVPSMLYRIISAVCSVVKPWRCYQHNAAAVTLPSHGQSSVTPATAHDLPLSITALHPLRKNYPRPDSFDIPTLCGATDNQAFYPSLSFSVQVPICCLSLSLSLTLSVFSCIPLYSSFFLVSSHVPLSFQVTDLS